MPLPVVRGAVDTGGQLHRTVDWRPRTTSVVINTDVCSVTPTVTRLSACPTATACNEANCAWVTLGDGADVDVTRYVKNCRPASTPWTEPLPPGYTPGPDATRSALPPPPPDDMESAELAGPSGYAEMVKGRRAPAVTTIGSLACLACLTD